jgi:hypothetical protein
MQMKAQLKEHTKTMLFGLWEASKSLFEATGQHIPLLCVLTNEGVQAEDLSMYMDEPVLMSAIIKMHQLKEGSNGTVFISEAWMAAVSEQDKKDLLEGKEVTAPSERENKKEVLIYVVETKVGSMIAMCDILRDPNRLGSLEILDGDDVELAGRFVGNSFRPMQ